MTGASGKKDTKIVQIGFVVPIGVKAKLLINLKNCRFF